MPSDKDRFSSTRERLINATRQFTRSTLLLQTAIAHKAGLNVTDAECIDFLLEMGPSTAGDLARATMLTTGAITNVIDRLEKAGFVRRERDEADRRKVIVRFLPLKHKKTHEYYSALSKNVSDLISSYKQEDAEFLIHHMESMKTIFDQNTALVVSSKERSSR